VVLGRYLALVKRNLLEVFKLIIWILEGGLIFIIEVNYFITKKFNISTSAISF